MSERSPRPAPKWRRGEIDLGRRRSLLVLSAAGASLASGDALAQAARCVLTENAGEGPFYFDPELMRSDVSDGSPGLPLDVAIQVTRASDCATLAAARVDLWQANAIGLYSGYAEQPGVGGVAADAALGETWLRGTQLTDADGWVRFRTVYPSWYGGRTPHLHFKVWLGADETVASQIFFPDETSAFVFEGFEPYRSHVAKRRVFNANDPLQQGVYCEVESQDETGVSANAAVAIDDAA
ncbi:MAG TPA: protocatechuate dioxygenase [Gammaproteobacteria bacterium]|nr:protocatechuate dioxygenase [Gammaproteobacteria bacterium]